MNNPALNESENEESSIYKKIEGEEISQKYDTRKLLLGIKRHPLAIILSVLFFAALGGIATYYYLTNYIATSVLLYKEDLPKTLPGGITLNTPSLNTALEIITLDANYQGVKARLGLGLSTKDIEKMIQVPRPAYNSYLIKIEAKSDNPHLAVDVANTLAQISVKRSQDLFAQQLQNELNSFTSQYTEANARLNKALDEIENFKKSHQYFEMTADYALLISQLSEARNKVQAANLRYNSMLIEYENLKQAAGQLPERVEGQSLNSGNGSGNPHFSRYDDLQSQLLSAKGKYAAENPKIKILEDQLKELNADDSSGSSTSDEESNSNRMSKNQTKEKLNFELMRMEGKVRSSKKTRDDLTVMLANLEKQLQTLPKDQIILVKLLKSKQQAEENADFLNKSIKTIQLMLNVPTGCFELYELAEKAKRIKDSKVVKVLPLFGMFFGLCFGLFLAIYLEMHDNKLRTLKQVHLLYDIPTLLCIPEFSFFGKKNGGEKTLYFIRHLAEKIDHMKIRRNRVEGKVSSILTIGITSSVKNEGKSCIANFLALYYQQKLGKKVILMELDSTPNIFDSIRSYTSLENYLEGKNPIESIIFFDSIDRIRVSDKWALTKEGVKSERMKQLMEKIKNEYDILIMDLPGVIEADFTTNLTAMSDIRLFVIGSTVVNKKMVDESLRDLFAVGIKPSGIILNRVLPIYIEDTRIKLELEKVKSSIWKKFFW